MGKKNTINIEIKCTDVFHGLSSLADETVDLTITSPPYNIGKEYEKVRPVEDYVKWCETWIREIYRVTKKNGAFWLNLGYLEIMNMGKAIPIAYLLWDKTPFYLLQEIIWHYGAGVSCKNYFSPRNEKWLWFVKSPDDYVFNLDVIRDTNVKYPNQKKNGKLKCNPLGKNPGDVWIIPKVTSGTNRSSAERTAHPAQFPIAVIDRIIQGCSNTGDLILDPFSGSGSTLVSAFLNERNCLGFEIKEDYCKMAERRLEIIRNTPQEQELSFG
ncbi:MAG TPA: site-specific DNA-methyltransferase [bacterium]|nr:site-specific DNA-methyltransferase [bacterium]